MSSNLIESKKAAVCFEDVTVAIHGYSILDSVTATVPAGSWTSVIGPNGAGKTSLILTLLGLTGYTGRIRFPSSNKHPVIGYVPQKFSIERGLPLTVIEFMLMGKQRTPFWFGCGKGKKNALLLLESVKAETLASRPVSTLSGGELQRVLLALALQEQPDLLVLDEPTAGVDLKGEQLFCELLEELRRDNGFTQIMVSHDLTTVTHHASHVICLNKRMVAEGSPAQVLNGETLTAMFGLHMGLIDASGVPNGKAVCSAECCKRKRNA